MRLALLLLLAACWTREDAGVVEVTVKRGDTLWAIARRYGVTVDELRAWNGLSGDRIEVGQVLRVHTDGAAAPPAAAKGRGRRRRAAKPAAEAPSGGLTMPAPKPCLAPPTLEAVLADEGLEALSPFPEPVGDLVRPRRFEVAAALNRLRTLEVLPAGAAGEES